MHITEAAYKVNEAKFDIKKVKMSAFDDLWKVKNIEAIIKAAIDEAKLKSQKYARDSGVLRDMYDSDVKKWENVLKIVQDQMKQNGAK